MTVPANPSVACTIAGSDSGGGAGIAADLATFHAHGVHGTFVLSAVTAQDTTKVHGITVLDASFVSLQLDAVFGDFPVRAVKTGMLATARIIDLVAERASAGALPFLVVDPVMIASSGAALVEGDAVSAYRRLVAHAFVITPNLPESEALLGRPVRSLEDMKSAARDLYELGPRYVLVKGGHLSGGLCPDVLFDGTDLSVLSTEKIATRNVHGTGCTLSAAIAANLSLGMEPEIAIEGAKTYVTEALSRSRSWHLGAGLGPLGHFGTAWSAP